jgi:hypothetical protein
MTLDELKALDRELDALNQKLSSIEYNSDEYNEIAGRYGEIQRQILLARPTELVAMGWQIDFMGRSLLLEDLHDEVIDALQAISAKLLGS